MSDIDSRVYGHEPAQSQLNRLRAEVAEARAAQCGDDEEREKLHEKIADLRAEVERMRGEIKNNAHLLYPLTGGKSSVLIPDEQIDEAWWYAHYHPRGEHRDICLELLSKLHIDECPECHGEGTVMDAVICDRCERHGWTIEENKP